MSVGRSSRMAVYRYENDVSQRTLLHLASRQGHVVAHGARCPWARPHRERSFGYNRGRGPANPGTEMASRTPNVVTPRIPAESELRRMISGREPAEYSKYVMQARTNVAYVGGTGVIDLKQFGFG